jgi:hypothetical protein
MAMGWLKGLVAPAAFGDNAQAPLPGMPQQGGPPVGGMPPQGGSPYGAAMPPPGTPPIGAPGGPAPYDASALPNAMQWSTGTRTQGAAQGMTVGAISPAASTVVGGVGAGAGAGGGGSAEARIAQLQHDVDSLALFARTLLTMLEESRVVTRAQFDATKSRLDMLDGKLDDR